jgi:hypothetical protein
MSDARQRGLIRLSLIAAGWALFYACYRWYYAAGGTFAMFGTPVSMRQCRRSFSMNRGS